METIIEKHEIPSMSKNIQIQMAGLDVLPSQKVEDISKEIIQDIVEKIRTGEYHSVMMAPDEDNEEGFFMLESSSDLIFLQIWDAETDTAWVCFNSELLDSNEEAPIKPSDGQSVIPLKYTVRDRELAAKCVEWYAYTCEPYPGMDWLKES